MEGMETEKINKELSKNKEKSLEGCLPGCIFVRMRNIFNLID